VDSWRSTEGLRRDLDPRAFPCLDEKTGAHQPFDDPSGGLGGHLQRVFDISNRQDRYAVVDDLFDDRAYDFRTTGVVTAIWQISRSFHCQARFSIRGGTAAGICGPVWPAMICSSKSGTLSAKRYTVSFNGVRLRRHLSVTRPAALVHPVQIRAAVYSAVTGRLFHSR